MSDINFIFDIVEKMINNIPKENQEELDVNEQINKEILQILFIKFNKIKINNFDSFFNNTIHLLKLLRSKRLESLKNIKNNNNCNIIYTFSIMKMNGMHKTVFELIDNFLLKILTIKKETFLFNYLKKNNEKLMFLLLKCNLNKYSLNKKTIMKLLFLVENNSVHTSDISRDGSIFDLLDIGYYDFHILLRKIKKEDIYNDFINYTKSEKDLSKFFNILFNHMEVTDSCIKIISYCNNRTRHISSYKKNNIESIFEKICENKTIKYKETKKTINEDIIIESKNINQWIIIKDMKSNSKINELKHNIYKMLKIKNDKIREKKLAEDNFTYSNCTFNSMTPSKFKYLNKFDYIKLIQKDILISEGVKIVDFLNEYKEYKDDIFITTNGLEIFFLNNNL